MIQLLERQAGGVWNVAGPEPEMDRVALAALFCRTLDLDDRFIQRVATADLGQTAHRPLNGALSTDKLGAAGLELRTTVEALEAWRGGEWEWPWPGR